jgi:hypothetical protein
MSSVAAAYSQVPARAKYFKVVPLLNAGASSAFGPQEFTIDSALSAVMTSDEFNDATTAGSDTATANLGAMYINKGKTVTVHDASANVTAVYALVRPVVAGELPATADVLVQVFDLTDPGKVRVVPA